MATLFHALLIALGVAVCGDAGSSTASRDATTGYDSPAAEPAWRWDGVGADMKSTEGAITETGERAWDLLWPDEAAMGPQERNAFSAADDTEPAMVPLPTPAVLAISGLVAALIIHRRQNSPRLAGR